MNFTAIDMQTWERSEVFFYFSQMAPTGYSLTVDLDVTEMRKCLQTAQMKFYPAYLWLVTKTLNKQKEFKLAEKDGKMGFYDTLTPLYAVFHEDDHTFSLLWTEFCESFPEFHQRYLDTKTEFGDNHGILGQRGELPPENAYTVSCVPWITFNHFAVHSFDRKPYYFPSVEAGKFCEKNQRAVMPLSVTCHHAAADGYHVSQFLEMLQAEADLFERYLE